MVEERQELALMMCRNDDVDNLAIEDVYNR